MAAIKFADLSNHRLTNYIFDLARFTRFEGETGPYLQYAAVRIKSLLKKAEEQGFKPGPSASKTQPNATWSCCSIASPRDRTAMAKRAPNVLCAFAFELAQASAASTPRTTSSANNAELRASRLAVCRLVLAQFSVVQGLLGIEIPERM